MNQRIAEYFDQIEARFLSSPVVRTFQIVRRQVSPSSGILRVKVSLGDSGLGEFFEYVLEIDSRIQIKKYSFHWQDKDGNLVKRWDNAPHYKLNETFDHMHSSDGTVSAVANPMSMTEAILEIEIEIGNERD